MSTSKKGANMRKESRAVLFGIFILALTATAGAQPLVFPLTGDQEVPPVTTDASGSCEATVSADAFNVSCTHDVTDLVAAHIHMAPAGVNGPIVFFLDFNTSFTASVTAESLEEQAMTFPVAGISFSEFWDLLHSGGLYINVHSPANPGGEIRGQIPSPPSFFFPQFGNGTEGDLTLTSDIVLLNTASTGDPITASVDLLDPDGNPLDVMFEGGTNEVMLDPNESATLRTDGMGDLVVGSASVTSNGSTLTGVVRFAVPGFGVAGVPASAPLQAGIAPVRNEGTIRTALAIRNTSNTDITAGIWFISGETMLHTEIMIPVGGRIAQFVDEIFEAELGGTEFSGSAIVMTDEGSFAAIALEQGPGVFTTLPFSPRQ